MKKSFWTILGFALLIMGFYALFLSLVGVKLSFLTFIDKPGALIGLIIRLAMIIAGFVILALVNTNWSQEGDEVIE